MTLFYHNQNKQVCVQLTSLMTTEGVPISLLPWNVFYEKNWNSVYTFLIVNLKEMNKKNCNHIIFN